MLTPARGYVSVIRRGSLSDRHTADDLERLYECDRRLAEIPSLDAQERRALELHARSIQCKLEWRRLIASVKSKSPAGALRPFTRSLSVSGYLVGKLAGEACARALRRLREAKSSHRPRSRAASATERVTRRTSPPPRRWRPSELGRRAAPKSPRRGRRRLAPPREPAGSPAVEPGAAR